MPKAAYLRQPNSRERGQAVVELALVLPLMLMLLLGIVQFGTVFRDYIALTDATRVGARQAAVARSIQPESDRVPNVVARTEKAAVNLNKAKMTITVTPIKADGVTPGWEQSGDVTVRATYPFKCQADRAGGLRRGAPESHDRTRRVATRTAWPLDHVPLRPWRGVREPFHRERRDVDERLAAEDEVTDELADGGALQEAVSGEARCIDEAGDLVGLADERVVVGRDLVVALPAARDPHVEERRQPLLGYLQDLLEPRRVGALHEPRLLLAIGHPEEEARAFAMEVEARREVHRERDARR